MIVVRERKHVVVAKRKRSAQTGIVAGVLGGTAFAALLILFGSVGWAAAGAAAAYGAGHLISRSRPKTRTFKVNGVTEAQLEAALKDGTAKVNELHKAASKIRSQPVRHKVTGLVYTAKQIIADIKDDPKDLKRARPFLNYYLDATIMIVRRYASLSAGGVESPEIRSSIERVESLLDMLQTAYEKQLAVLLEDDVMDLETELEVLERTIRMEGLVEDEG